MSENQEKESQIKSSELAKTDSFDAAIDSRNSIIEKKNRIIKELQDKLGKREERISQLMEEVDEKETLRIEAEKKVTQDKPLEKPGRHFVPKSKEELFAEKYQAACRKVRENG